MASLLDLAQARLQGLLDIPTRVGRAVVNPTLFSGLLGAPTLPKETGMAQAAYGLPAQPNMSVLDPEQRAYLEGYAQGEPYSYLGMATPFAAPAVAAGTKAIAPKAGMALENYMVSQGLLQPLTAYHGTPHTIRGQFDISKVGTGEGAQAYGHGMYFAENPAVANQYIKAGDEGFKANAAEYAIKEYGNVDNAIQQLSKKLLDKNEPSWKKDNINVVLEGLNKVKLGQSTGNLYKVDIPDEYIPKMLDWDKPVPEQLRKQISKASMEQFGSGATGTSGELLYKEIVFEMRRNGSLTPEADAAKWLDSQGIKGIRYEDAGSRGKEGKGTFNYVVFDPTDVKILEKNSQKVEGLLE